MFFDPLYFIVIGPALILGIIAQIRIKTTFAQASKIATHVSGTEAARAILDHSGLQNVGIEEISGFLSDHYDPRHKVLRLSPEVSRGRNLAAVGVASHEAGHALQDAQDYAPLKIRNAVVPVAGFGSNFGILLVIIGAIAGMNSVLIWAGIGLFSAVVFFQVVNLPVEFNASNRAKAMLVDMGMVHEQDIGPVKSVLGAAAMTYVAATLQAILTLLYLIIRFTGHRD